MIETDESSEGSDDEPSVDNLDEDDLKKLLPTKGKPQSNTLNNNIILLIILYLLIIFYLFLTNRKIQKA